MIGTPTLKFLLVFLKKKSETCHGKPTLLSKLSIKQTAARVLELPFKPII